MNNPVNSEEGPNGTETAAYPVGYGGVGAMPRPDGGGNYRAEFLTKPAEEALVDIITGAVIYSPGGPTVL